MWERGASYTRINNSANELSVLLDIGSNLFFSFVFFKFSMEDENACWKSVNNEILLASANEDDLPDSEL